MPALPDLQRAFAAAVYADNDAVAVHLRPGRFPAARHLQVYRNNVFESLSGALKAVYPVVERLVGTGFFAYAVNNYIHAFPLVSGDLHDFGEHLADFLATFEPARELVYLPDVARLEWAQHWAFHAADHAPLTIERLAAVPPGQYGQLRFKLHPSVQLIASDYPILRIWQVNQPGHKDDIAVTLADGGVQLLVVRRGLEVETTAVTGGDWALLSAFADEQDFETASQAALLAQSDYDLTAALRRYVTSAVIIDFSITGDRT